jgi:hypothetical protein
LPFIRYTFGLFGNGPAKTGDAAKKAAHDAKAIRKLVWRKTAKPDIVAEFGGNVEEIRKTGS